jgi:hypothetical protein
MVHNYINSFGITLRDTPEGRDCMRGDRRKTSVEWPAAVDDRLRHLVDLAEEAAELRTTSASELLAALIWAEPLDGARLAATITAYRQTGRDTMEAVRPGDQNPPRTPRRGRPRRNWLKNTPRAGGAAHEPPSEPCSERRTPGQGESDHQ